MTPHDTRPDTAAPPTPAAAGTSVDVDLTGRTALVTGAASGIGRACATRLAAAGATVRLVDLNREALDELAQRGIGEPHHVDLTDLDAVDTVARGVDIVVNNAGVQTVCPVHEFPPERFSMMVKLMLEAPFRIVRAALPHMYARNWGRIINISSVHGLRASAYKSAYVAAKHGLEGFSKVVALEGAPHGVTSNCINPGYGTVEQQTPTRRAHGSRHDVVEAVLLARNPIKRLSNPPVAEMVAYLCPEAFINGAS